MAVMPRLADLQCKPLRFLPGDRVLVKVHHRLEKEQESKIRKTIEKWAGVPIEVLIYCDLDMEVSIEQSQTG